MLIVRKDKRKLTLQKRRVWNREIKFEPGLDFGTYEGVGNARIRLWKPLNNGPSINIHKRKHGIGITKIKGKSQNITSQKLINKRPVIVAEQSGANCEQKPNEEEFISYSSPDNTIYGSINDTVEVENTSFNSNSSPDYSYEAKAYCTETQFIQRLETLKHVVDKLMTSEPIGEIFYPHNLIKYPSNIEEENASFKSQRSTDYPNENKQYVSNQFATESQMLKNITDKFMESELNNISNDEKIFFNAEIESLSGPKGENILFIPQYSPDHTSKNYEYDKNQFTTESENLKCDQEEHMKSDLNTTERILSDLNEYQSESNDIYPNTSQYNGPITEPFISLEDLLSDSEDFYQNVRKTWSLESSKVLMTPSKQSIKSENTSASIGQDIMEESEKPNIESTHMDYIELLEAIDGRLNDVISQVSGKTTSQDEVEIKLNDFRSVNQFQNQPEQKDNVNDNQPIAQQQYDANNNQLENQPMAQQKDDKNYNQPMTQLTEANDHQNEDQTTKTVQEGKLNDNQFSNNMHVKFIVLKKSRENQETILDSSEDIEKNIFTRNKISPDFENLINNSMTRPSSNERRLLTEENEIDNTVGSKVYSLADILHEELSKNYDTTDFETKPEVSQEVSKPIFEKENFSLLNNLKEVQTVQELFNNEKIQNSNQNIQKVMSLQSSENINSILPTNSADKYVNNLPECTNLLAASMSITEKLHSEEMKKHDPELVSVKIAGKKTGNATEKNINNTNDKHSETNFPSSSTDTDCNHTMNSKKPEDDDFLCHHIATKHNHKINDFHKEYDEVTKQTDEIIKKIMNIKTHEELLELMKHDLSETESIDKKDITNHPESHSLVDKQGTNTESNDSPFQSRLESNHNNQNVNIKDVIKKFKKDDTDNSELNETFISSIDCGHEKLRDNLNPIATSSHIVSKENEAPEKFRVISEEKEKSSQIINMKMNEIQSNYSSDDSIITGISNDEKSTTKQNGNVQNTNLYYINHQVKSPYITPCTKQNMLVNLNNERKNTLQDKFYSCLRKLNFISKKKSTTSLSSNKSNSRKLFNSNNST